VRHNLHASAVSPRRRAAAACALLACVAPATGRAQAPPPAERAHVYSAYEQETIGRVLASLHARVDLAPEGKLIEQIDIVPLDVFEESDPLPRWLNVLHATTRPSIVRREMLLREGDRYRQVLCDDTLRDLRHLIQLSVVVIVATPGSDDGRVRVVVITKDVWSLRANWNLVVNRGGFESFVLEPDERNLAGVHHVASGLFMVDPATFTFGAGYQIPRIDASRIALDASADVVVNRDSGALEGSGAALVVGQPIYSGLTDWSWDATVAYGDYISRRFVDAAPSFFRDPVTGVTVPFAYRSRTYAAVYEATRSLGWEVKHDFTVGADVRAAAYRPAFTADARTTSDFERAYVPANDERIGPFVQYHSYTKRYVRLFDFETLALQEDASLGPEAVLRAFPSFRALGGAYDVLGIYAAAQYSIALRDGFFRASLGSTTEPQPDHIGNAAISPSARLVTPTIAGLGRLVVDGAMLYRWRDELNIKGACAGASTYAPFNECSSFLGGSNRLRGFPTNFLVGKDFAAYNVELRSRPIDVLTLQLAGTLFYDSGGASNDLGNGVRVLHSVGVGIRAVFGWLDRQVFRADIGFPLERPIDPATGSPVPPFGFVISFGQAFDVPNVARPSILPTGQSSW
jgi:hypothetical protein